MFKKIYYFIINFFKSKKSIIKKVEFKKVQNLDTGKKYHIEIISFTSDNDLELNLSTILNSEPIVNSFRILEISSNKILLIYEL